MRIWITTSVLALVLSARAAPCELEFVLHVQPSQIDVSLRLPANATGATKLGMTTSWAGVGDLAAKQILVEGEGGTLELGEGPGRWLLRHTDTTRLHYRIPLKQLRPGESQEQVEMHRPQGAPDHFQVFGYGLFLLPEAEQDVPREVCLRWQLQEPLTAPLFNSFGRAKPGSTQQFRASANQLRHAVYAGGEGWRLREEHLPNGGLLQVAVRGSFPFASDRRFAQRAGQLVAEQQRFWHQPGDGKPSPQWLLVTPNFSPRGSYGGTLVNRSAVLHVTQDFALDSPSFVKLIAHESLHDWIPGRFGASNFGAKADVSGYWFSEGFTEFFTHRLLLASGVWSLETYANRLSDRLRHYEASKQKTLTAAAIAPIFHSELAASEQLYLRGEWLALRWEDALRQKPGAPSLAVLMRGLLLPVNHSEKTQPGERLLAALRPYLGDQADEEVRRVIGEGEVLKLEDIPGGPCLRLETVAEFPYTLGFDPGSFDSKKVSGVDLDGPAHAAGLREGVALVHWSFAHGDKQREVVLQVRGEDDKLSDVRYLPVSRKAVEAHVWRPRANAAKEPTCHRWRALL